MRCPGITQSRQNLLQTGPERNDWAMFPRDAGKQVADRKPCVVGEALPRITRIDEEQVVYPSCVSLTAAAETAGTPATFTPMRLCFRSAESDASLQPCRARGYLLHRSRRRD